MAPAIEIRGVSKEFRLFHEHYSSLKDRLAHLGRIPFEMIAADGATLNLLRVEIDALADVGSLTPHLGGGSFRYDPLPARLVSHRRRLRFVYFDGEKLRPLTFTDVRAA